MTDPRRLGAAKRHIVSLRRDYPVTFSAELPQQPLMRQVFARSSQIGNIEMIIVRKYWNVKKKTGYAKAHPVRFIWLYGFSIRDSISR